MYVQVGRRRDIYNSADFTDLKLVPMVIWDSVFIWTATTATHGFFRRPCEHYTESNLKKIIIHRIQKIPNRKRLHSIPYKCDIGCRKQNPTMFMFRKKFHSTSWSIMLLIRINYTCHRNSHFQFNL